MAEGEAFYVSRDPKTYPIDIGLAFGPVGGTNGRSIEIEPPECRPYVKPAYDVTFTEPGRYIASMDRGGMLTLYDGHTPEEAAEVFVAAQAQSPYALYVSPGMLLCALDPYRCGPLERAFWRRVRALLAAWMAEGE